MNATIPTATRLERRRTLFVVAALVPMFAVCDALSRGGRFAFDAFAVRLCWALVLLLCGVRLPEVSDRAYRMLLFVAATSSPIFYALICALLGGTQSILWAWALAIPVGIAALLQDEVEAAAGGVVGSVLSAAALLWFQRVGWDAALLWLLLYAASAIITIHAALTFRRIRGAEWREQKERVDTQAQLARSERRRAQAEKLAVVGQLATGVAHEVRNPLQLAMLQLDFLRNEKMSEGSRERVAQVNRALEKIAQIVNDLRGFAAADVGTDELEEVKVEDVLDETLRLADLRLKRVARVEQKLGAAVPTVRAQRQKLSQVLLNLLVNAADALEASRREDALIRVDVARHDGGVRIAVEDNGPGIPADVMPRLFEPFFTTKGDGKGTGLGLALSREYVERFGGALSVENREGGGARFIIDLPAEETLPPTTSIKN